MAEDQTSKDNTQDGDGAAAQPQEPDGAAAQPQEPDYKALYEQAKADVEKQKAEARKWEKRSKANRDAAKGAQDAAQKSVEDEVADLKAKIKRMEDEKAHADLVAKVAREKGVPAELLRGKDEDELSAFADSLAEYAKKSAPGVPADKGGSPAGGSRMTIEQIGKIKSPLERVQAYARMHAGQ
ncbi:MAG: hypothetical protein ACI360_08550 [Atopobiaceae bacterium]